MAGNMVRMATNPEEAGRMGRAGRRRVEARYLLADRLESLASILHEARQTGEP
jgi:hypothetical protein